MKVATRVRTLMLMPILVGVAVGVIVAWSYQARESAVVANHQADQLQETMLALVHIAGDYTLHPNEERPIRQLWAMYDDLAVLIDRPEMVEIAGTHLVNGLRISHADLGKLLRKYEGFARSGGGSSEVLQSAQAVRTMEWIHVTIQEMVGKVRNIHVAAEAAQGDIDQLAWRWVISVTLVLAMASAIIALTMGRDVNARLHTLHEGTDRIGEGDLTYRLNITGNDEFSQLSGSFNAMSERLARTMASRDDLNMEVEQRKQAAEALREARAFMRDVIDSMPSVMICVGSEGEVTHWNREAERFTGQSFEQAVGQPIREVFPDIDRVLPDLGGVIASPSLQHFAKRELESGGERRFVDIAVYPLLTASTTSSAIRIDDITERLKVEEMVFQGEKLLSVSGLAAGMAHEMNNPLGGIVQGVQNIRRRLSADLPKNAKVAEDVGLDFAVLERYLEERQINPIMNDIMEAGGRVSAIVKRLLRFARETGRSEKAYTDVAVLLDEALELAMLDYDLKKVYAIRDIDIKRDFSPGVPTVQCVVPDIEQVLLNVLRNAAQWLRKREEGAEPACIALRTAIDGDFARIDIEDNGPGMDAETQQRAFEPFFTRHETGEGAGLGLAVSFFIVHDEHKGRMTIDAEPGRGTKVSLWLPLAQRVGEESAP